MKPLYNNISMEVARYEHTNLGKANLTDKIEEIVYVIGMAKIQLGRLPKNVRRHGEMVGDR